MKISTVILAGLMTMTSVAAFAEGGSERSKEFYNNFTFVRNKSTVLPSKQQWLTARLQSPQLPIKLPTRRTADLPVIPCAIPL